MLKAVLTTAAIVAFLGGGLSIAQQTTGTNYVQAAVTAVKDASPATQKPEALVAARDRIDAALASGEVTTVEARAEYTALLKANTNDPQILQAIDNAKGEAAQWAQLNDSLLDAGGEAVWSPTGTTQNDLSLDDLVAATE